MRISLRLLSSAAGSVIYGKIRYMLTHEGLHLQQDVGNALAGGREGLQRARKGGRQGDSEQCDDGYGGAGEAHCDSDLLAQVAQQRGQRDGRGCLQHLLACAGSCLEMRNPCAADTSRAVELKGMQLAEALPGWSGVPPLARQTQIPALTAGLAVSSWPG
jgi:hypothetical protein